MRLQKYLVEKYLMGEFTFGFELEAFARLENGKNGDKHDWNGTYDRIINHYKSIWGSDPDIGDDSSVHASVPSGLTAYDDVSDYMTFELKSHVIQFTPQNIIFLYKYLNGLRNIQVYTNESCGFHIHFKTPTLDYYDMSWLLVQFAMNIQGRKLLTGMKIKDKVVPFISAQFADDGFLDYIARNIMEQDWDELSDTFDSEKYRVARMHPQGTFEWRGPRAFLENGSKAIHDFTSRVIELVQFMRKALDTPSVKTHYGILTKAEFFDHVEIDIEQDLSRLHIDLHKFNAEEQDLYELRDIFKKYPWLGACRFQHARLTIEAGVLYFDQGEFLYGNWKTGFFGSARGGTPPKWIDGIFSNGYVLSGVRWKDGAFKNGVFYGKWEGGVFLGGTFNGEWYGGKWEDGKWGTDAKIWDPEHRTLVKTNKNPNEYFTAKGTVLR